MSQDINVISNVTLHAADYGVIALYFLVLAGFGFLFKKMNTTTKDYFAGGGSMLWWLVGATAFMTIFSSWTFAGAAGQAYNTGFQVSFLFIGNAVGYFIASRWTAPRVRQLNAITPIEVVRKRYGKINEQVFTWVRFPISLIQAGTWLSSLSVFMSSAFNWEPATAVIICAAVVTVMTLLGGSWAVIASDYLQMLVIMIISITTAVVVLIKTGGMGNIVENFGIYRPGQNFWVGDYNHLWLFVVWAALTTLRSVFAANNMSDSYRYLAAADTKNASKGAKLAGYLMIFGSILWFVPAWAASTWFQNSQLAEMFPSLKNAGESVYMVMVKQFMPAGMTGLLLAGVFAATMSSMDSALNTNTGIFIRNFYKPIINKNATDAQLLRLSKITILIFGVCITFVGIFISQLQGLTLFDIMLRINALIRIPLFIPLVFGIYIKKVPDWAAWATLVVGGFVSAFCGSWLNALLPHFAEFNESLTGLERKDLIVTWASVCHLTITLGFFLLTRFFYKETGSERDKERDAVFEAFKTPVIAELTPASLEKYRFQRNVLGMVSFVAGCVVGVLAFLPAEFMISRVVVIAAAGILITVGILLRKSAKEKKSA